MTEPLTPEEAESSSLAPLTRRVGADARSDRRAAAWAARRASTRRAHRGESRAMPHSTTATVMALRQYAAGRGRPLSDRPACTIVAARRPSDDEAPLCTMQTGPAEAAPSRRSHIDPYRLRVTAVAIPTVAPGRRPHPGGDR